MSTLIFTLRDPSTSQFSPRCGNLSFTRQDGSSIPDIFTPGLITKSSRGIVPHLSRDHVQVTPVICWTQIHFETFLEHEPPAPTLRTRPHSLHTFLGYRPNSHLLSLSVRDPHDGQEMPPNGRDFVSCRCVRGVRKMTPASWRAYVFACKPDVVTALADTPFTPPPHSHKRTIKSLERSTAWLADLLRSPSPQTADVENSRLIVLVNMAGGIDTRARRAFAEGLVENLCGKDLELISPLKTLDEGVAGYVFDLVPLHAQLGAEQTLDSEKDTSGRNSVAQLLATSLSPLPASKPRIAHSARSPHEILHLIQEVGIDLFDAQWAQDAADIGIALDFSFPVRDVVLADGQAQSKVLRSYRCNKLDLGHNLFDAAYAHDHSRLASPFLDAASSTQDQAQMSLLCSCAACSPRPLPSWIQHSSVDIEPAAPAIPQRPFTRSYIHHLLHTHEMSSHALLAMHNLTVTDAFFAGIRAVLSGQNGLADFRYEVSRFTAAYDEEMVLFAEARINCAAVEKARGKGRLQRERSDASTLNC